MGELIDPFKGLEEFDPERVGIHDDGAEVVALVNELRGLARLWGFKCLCMWRCSLTPKDKWEYAFGPTLGEAGQRVPFYARIHHHINLWNRAEVETGLSAMELKEAIAALRHRIFEIRRDSPVADE